MTAFHIESARGKARRLAERYWSIQASIKPGPRGRVTRANKAAHAEQIDLIRQVSELLDLDIEGTVEFLNSERGE